MIMMYFDDVRIVVVDDVVDIVEVLVMILVFVGYEVWIVLSGEVVLEFVEEFQLLCVLMDINMLGFGGYEFCQCLWECYGDDFVLIVVIGVGYVDDCVGVSFVCFDYYLCKLVDIKLLMQLFLFVY